MICLEQPATYLWGLMQRFPDLYLSNSGINPVLRNNSLSWRLILSGRRSTFLSESKTTKELVDM